MQLEPNTEILVLEEKITETIPGYQRDRFGAKPTPLFEQSVCVEVLNVEQHGCSNCCTSLAVDVIRRCFLQPSSTIAALKADPKMAKAFKLLLTIVVLESWLPGFAQESGQKILQSAPAIPPQPKPQSEAEGPSYTFKTVSSIIVVDHGASC
jgi:hypothetical protein